METRDMKIPNGTPHQKIRAAMNNLLTVLAMPGSKLLAPASLMGLAFGKDVLLLPEMDTVWPDVIGEVTVEPTDEEVAAKVRAWLDRNPEPTYN